MSRVSHVLAALEHFVDSDYPWRGTLEGYVVD
jgi:hypothetical protein